MRRHKLGNTLALYADLAAVLLILGGFLFFAVLGIVSFFTN